MAAFAIAAAVTLTPTVSESQIVVITDTACPRGIVAGRIFTVSNRAFAVALSVIEGVATAVVTNVVACPSDIVVAETVDSDVRLEVILEDDE